MLLALLLAAAPLLTNDRVALWELSGPREALAHDAVLVEIASGAARLVPKGQALDAKGKAVAVELLAPPQGALPNRSGQPDAFETRPGIEKLLDEARFTVWRYQWQKGKRTQLHFHAKDAVPIFLVDGTLNSITPDGKVVPMKHTAGMARFSLKARVHQEELVEGEAKAVIVELK
jgi:hypothetical protein